MEPESVGQKVEAGDTCVSILVLTVNSQVQRGRPLRALWERVIMRAVKLDRWGGPSALWRGTMADLGRVTARAGAT